MHVIETTCFCLQSVPTTAYLVLFIQDQIRYSNLIRQEFKLSSKNMDILLKLLALLEDQEKNITDRNTKIIYQITNSADQPLSVIWIVICNLPVKTPFNTYSRYW